MRNAVAIAALLLLVAPSPVFAQSSPDMVAALQYGPPAGCTADETALAAVGRAYFQGVGDPHALMEAILNTCPGLTAARQSPYVVTFLAAPTDYSQLTVLHLLYNGAKKVPLGVTRYPGISRAAWIFVGTSDQTPGGLLSFGHADHPLLDQVGKLIETIATPIGALVPNQPLATARHTAPADKPSKKPLRVWMAAQPIPFKRGSITETDYVVADVKNSDGKFEPAQIDGTLVIDNTPLTSITANVAFFGFRAVKGARGMKVDEKTYASDPGGSVATSAGITIHVPFDSAQPTASPQERFGIFVGGIMTPNAGVAVAVTGGWRGFSLAAGCGVLAVKTAPAGKSIGDVADGTTQLVNRPQYSLLLGGTYKFGG